MILYLQQFISEKFNNLPQILNQVKSIYIQTVVNSSFPYIYIGDFNSKNISTKNNDLVEVHFKVIIYFRDKNIKPMLRVADEIKKILHIDAEEKVVLLRYINELVQIQNDGVTQQIILNFRAIVKGEENYV